MCSNCVGGVCGFDHMSAGVLSGQRQLIPTQSCSYRSPKVVLGIELRSFPEQHVIVSAEPPLQPNTTDTVI